ncbi:SMR family transporter [Stenotrophomonas pictorum]|uniref:SMR family transporter n=1 Tax=Stenotrophomonas pictorum TaxID=86184 RepID=UPI0031B63262
MSPWSAGSPAAAGGWPWPCAGLGTACTIWTGIGAVGAFAVGIVLLGQQIHAGRMGAALLIVDALELIQLSSRCGSTGRGI